MDRTIRTGWSLCSMPGGSCQSSPEIPARRMQSEVPVQLVRPHSMFVHECPQVVHPNSELPSDGALSLEHSTRNPIDDCSGRHETVLSRLAAGHSHSGTVLMFAIAAFVRLPHCRPFLPIRRLRRFLSIPKSPVSIMCADKVKSLLDNGLHRLDDSSCVIVV